MDVKLVGATYHRLVTLPSEIANKFVCNFF